MQTAQSTQGSTPSLHGPLKRHRVSKRSAYLHMHANMVAQHHRGSPSGEVAVHCARELSLGCIPLVSRLEGDVGGSVVDDREGAHPEVVPAAAQVAELSGSCSPKVSHKCSMSVSGALLNNQQLARVGYGPPKTTNPWPCATEAMHCQGSAA